MNSKREKIFEALNKNFIQNFFDKKRKFFFPSNQSEIFDLRIKKTSPDWAKDDCKVKYEIIFKDGTQKNIRGTANAKTSKRPIWQIINHLYFNGFGVNELRVTKPLAYLSDINLLLYEEAPGITLTELIEKQNEIKIGEALKTSVRWLAKLHDLNLKGTKIRKAQLVNLSDYKKLFRKIEKLIPELKKDIIPQEKLTFIGKIRRGEKTLIHNDFCPGNIIVNSKNIIIIDFDRSGIGPFWTDVASLYNALDFPKNIWSLNISSKKIKSFQKIISENYSQFRKIKISDVEKNLNKFSAKACLDQVYYFANLIFDGGEKIEKNTKEEFILKIKEFLKKANRYLNLC